MKKIIVLLIMFFLMPMAFADSAPTQALMANLRQLQSAQGDFEQQIKDGNGNKLQTTKGHFALNRPEAGNAHGLFYWNVTSEPKQQLVADGKNFWFYDASLQQVTKQSQSAVSAQNSPAMLLSGDLSKISAQYNITLATSEAQQTFMLTPLSANSSFIKLIITFNQNHLTKMQAIDALGNTTDITFSHVTSPAPANLFVFQKPNGAEVVTA